MIPAIPPRRAVLAMLVVVGGGGVSAGGAVQAAPPMPAEITALPSVPSGPANCMDGGGGYLRARLAGAIDAQVEWLDSGTRCQGEARYRPPGVRLSFERAEGGNPNLLFVFGVSGVREGQPANAVGVNLTVIVQGTDHIYGTLGDARCTVDALTQKPLRKARTYRVEARGFCTQPAHAVRGDGDVLVSTFEFSGPVTYDEPAG